MDQLRAQGRWENRPILGIVYMMIGLALYPISDALIKFLMHTSYGVAQTAFIRAATRAIPLIGIAALQKKPLAIFKTKRPGLHLARLAVNLASTYAFIYAFSHSSLTSVYTLGYTSPFFVILLSGVLLKEPIGFDRWLAVSLGMLGLLVAVQPGSDLWQWASVIVLAGTFLGALNKTMMRWLAATEHSLSIAIYPNLTMMLATLPWLIHHWQPVSWEHAILFMLVGCLAAVGQYAIAQALHFTQASILAPIDYSSFFWVIGLDYLCWSVVPSLSTLAGAAIIVSSNLYILYRSRKEPST